MIKGKIHQKDKFINIYAPNLAAPKYIKELLTELKIEIDCSTIIRAFHTPLTSMNRSYRQKVNKETALNDTLSQ